MIKIKKLENFSTEELAAIIHRLGRDHWIKGVEQEAIRYGLDERIKRIQEELERLYSTDKDTLKQLGELAKRYEGMAAKDVPPADLDRLIKLQTKFDKAQKKQATLYKREQECWKQYTATYETVEV